MRIGPANSFPVTPAYQNNEQIYNLIYMYTQRELMIMPYYQYTVVKSDPTYSAFGISPTGAHTNGGAVLANYAFKHGFSLAVAAGIHQVERKRGDRRGQLAGVWSGNRRVFIHRDPDLGQGRLLPSGGPLGRSPDQLRHRGRWIWNRPARSPLDRIEHQPVPRSDRSRLHVLSWANHRKRERRAGEAALPPTVVVVLVLRKKNRSTTSRIGARIPARK